MAALSRIPLLHQPGEAWLYNTCSDIQGVLIARVSGRPLPEFLAERLFEPLGMADTGFEVPAGKLGRFTSFYRADPAGGLELVDAPGGQWSSLPAFPSGAGGLVSTADDWHAFARMLLAGGSARRPPAAVARLGAADDHRPSDPGPARRQRGCSWRARAGASAARSTSRPSTHGTCRDATAGSAAPARRRTSSRPPARSPSCSASWRWPGRPRPR